MPRQPRPKLPAKCHPERLSIGKEGWCKKCYDYRYAQANKPRYYERYNKKYGITTDEFNRVLTNQGGVCAICGETPWRWVGDHDHTTNKFRGLLCITCNTALGAFKDNTAILQRAINYLNENTV